MPDKDQRLPLALAVAAIAVFLSIMVASLMAVAHIGLGPVMDLMRIILAIAPVGFGIAIHRRTRPQK